MRAVGGELVWCGVVVRCGPEAASWCGVVWCDGEVRTVRRRKLIIDSFPELRCFESNY